MNIESKLMSSVLNDKQIHVLLQANVDSILLTHEDIWHTIKNHYETYQAVPSVAVVQEKHPDFAYTEITEGTKYHLDELKSAYLDNGIRHVLRSASSCLQDGKSVEALDMLINEGAHLRQVASNVKDLNAADLSAAMSYYERQMELRDQGSLGIYTGLEGFDTCLPSGIMPGHFGVLLASPATGKSWLLAYLAVCAWRDGKTPLILSLEMTEAEVRNRLYTIIADGFFSHRALSRGEVNLEEFKRWHDKTFDGMPPIHIISSDIDGAVTPSVVRGKIEQYKPDIVFLDYLNLMDSNERAESETVKMKQLSRQLKILAVSEELAIVAISSATPDGLADNGQPPTLMQVSWSKQIAYDADWLMALGREPNSDIMTCVLRKNRHGFMGEFLLNVDFDAGRFVYAGVPD